MLAQQQYRVNSAGDVQEVEGNIQSSWMLGELVTGVSKSGNLSLNQVFIPLELIPGYEEGTAVEELLLLENLKSYPVPAQDDLQLTFNWEERDEFQLDAYNLSGEKLMSSNQQIFPGQNDIALDVRAWPAGQYFIRLSNAEGKTAVSKIQVR